MRDGGHGHLRDLTGRLAIGIGLNRIRCDDRGWQGRNGHRWRDRGARHRLQIVDVDLPAGTGGSAEAICGGVSSGCGRPFGRSARPR